MRIISGKYKGRYIPVRKNFPSRPTTDFAKENLFNVLSNHFDMEELKVLDLFSGTGSISYEFASRGASVVLIEKDFRSLSFIKKNIQELKFDNIKTFRADVFKAIPKIKEKFNIVFADPPFDMKRIEEIPELVVTSGIIEKEGWFILEHSRDHDFKGLSYLREVRTYGSVNFSIFTPK